MAPPFFPPEDPSTPPWMGQQPPRGNPWAAMQPIPNATQGNPFAAMQPIPNAPVGINYPQQFMGMDPNASGGQFPPQVGPGSMQPMNPMPSFMGQPPQGGGYGGMSGDPIKDLASVIPPGGPDEHPGFFDFMLGKTDPSGSAMAAAIMANSVLHPQESLQWAQKFAEHRQNQQFMAQQNEMNRQAKIEKTKQDQGYSKVAKAMAGALTKNIDANEFIAQQGPITPDNVDEFQAWTTAKAAVNAKTTEANSKENKVRGYQAKILTQNLKQPMEASIYTDPNSPDYNEDFAKNLEHGNKIREGMAADRLAREHQMTDLRTAQNKILAQRERLLKGAKTDQEKEDVTNLYKQVDLRVKLALQAGKQANNFEVFGDDWAKAGEVYTKNHDEFNRLIDEASTILTEAGKRTGVAPVDLSGGDSKVPTEAPTTQEDPKARLERTYLRLYKSAETPEAKQKIYDSYKRQYGEPPKGD